MAAPLAVVVGAGPGLGLSVARRFAAGGFRVAVMARTPGRLDLSGLDGPDRAPLAVAADVTDEAGLRAAFAQVREMAGDPEVLVYNTSTYVAGPPTAMAYDAFTAGLASGVSGALVAVQEVAPAMRAAGHGTVLLTGSGVALGPSVGAAGLAVAKAGLRSLALSLAEELRPDGVHVATVTIRGVLGSGPFFEPDTVAATYWDLYEETAALPSDRWHAEVSYGPAA